jgi:hypothetical protein
METAKVDIKKLQILSDRINQCIDALNQVRLSVHGLTQTNPFGQVPGFGQAGLGQPGVGGLSHTSGVPFPTMGGINPGSNPYANPYAGIGALGLGTQGQFPGQIGQSPFPGASPFFGLSHTGAEGTEAFRSTWNDPYLAAKVSQTFPYLQFAVPPVVSLY